MFGKYSGFLHACISSTNTCSNSWSRRGKNKLSNEVNIILKTMTQNYQQLKIDFAVLSTLQKVVQDRTKTGGKTYN
jgi:uncharacterized protein involved in tolerance to divalent cations